MNYSDFLINLNEFSNKIRCRSKNYRDMCVNILADEIVCFIREDEALEEFNKIRMAFNELLISLIDPERAELLDQNNDRAGDDDF